MDERLADALVERVPEVWQHPARVEQRVGDLVPLGARAGRAVVVPPDGQVPRQAEERAVPVHNAPLVAELHVGRRADAVRVEVTAGADNERRPVDARPCVHGAGHVVLAG